MTFYPNYGLERAPWGGWRWQANFRGEAVGRGYALSRRGARWAARGWLRELRRQRESRGAEVRL